MNTVTLEQFTSDPMAFLRVVFEGEDIFVDDGDVHRVMITRVRKKTLTHEEYLEKLHSLRGILKGAPEFIRDEEDREF